MTTTEQQLCNDYEMLRQEYTQLLELYEGCRARSQQCIEGRHCLQEELTDARTKVKFMATAKAEDICKKKCEDLEEDCEALVKEHDEI
jgi:hypothetical protein